MVVMFVDGRLEDASLLVLRNDVERPCANLSLEQQQEGTVRVKDVKHPRSDVANLGAKELS